MKDRDIKGVKSVKIKNKNRFLNLKQEIFFENQVFQIELVSCLLCSGLIIDKLTLKGNHYQQVKCHIDWDTTTINEKEYSVVRVALIKRDGKPIHKEPMLLISTLKISNYLDAKEIYHIYLHRAKIEGVFKFLKDTLGWEEYQVRDWESIKNIISICYFIGGYFYEIHSELIENETVQMICNLARNKGKITHHFFLEGLKIMLLTWHVENFKGNVQNSVSA